MSDFPWVLEYREQSILLCMRLHKTIIENGKYFWITETFFSQSKGKNCIKRLIRFWWSGVGEEILVTYWGQKHPASESINVRLFFVQKKYWTNTYNKFKHLFVTMLSISPKNKFICHLTLNDNLTIKNNEKFTPVSFAIHATFEKSLLQVVWQFLQCFNSWNEKYDKSTTVWNCWGGSLRR